MEMSEMQSSVSKKKITPGNPHNRMDPIEHGLQVLKKSRWISVLRQWSAYEQNIGNPYDPTKDQI